MLGDNTPRLVYVVVKQSPLSLVKAVTVHPVGFASLVSRSVLLIFTTAAMLVHKRSKAPVPLGSECRHFFLISCQLERFLRW